MADKLAELFVEINADTTKLDSSLKKVKADLDKVAISAMAAGATIATGLAFAVKSAENERLGIVKLGAALKNVGVNYDDVKESLESVIATTQRKTGIADDKQRDALRKLTVVTGDYKKALNLLPLALDMSVAMTMDAESAAQLLGRVMEGNTGILGRYGIVLKEGATAAEALAAIQQKVGGSAEAAASPLAIMSAALGDLSETIGGALLPAFNSLLNENVIPFVEKLTEWIKLNPNVVKSVAMLAVALLAGGGLIYALGMLSKTIIAVNTALIILQSLTGVGILKVLLGLGVASGAIYGMNELMKSTPQGYASGGIVTQPQLAMVGEAGPEAIIPLSQMGGMGSSVVVNVGNYMGDEISKRALVRDIQRILNEENRRSVTPGIKTNYYSVGGHL